MYLEFNNIAKVIKTSTESYRPTASLEIENAYLRTLVKQHAPSLEGYAVVSTESVWETIKNILKKIKEWIFGSASDETEEIKKTADTAKTNIEKVKKEPEAKEKEVTIINSNEELDKFMLGDKGEKSESPKKHEPSAIVTSDPIEHYVYSNLNESIKDLANIKEDFKAINSYFSDDSKEDKSKEKTFRLVGRHLTGEGIFAFVKFDGPNVLVEIDRKTWSDKASDRVFKLDYMADKVLKATVDVSEINEMLLHEIDLIKEQIRIVENNPEPEGKEEIDLIRTKMSSLQARKKILTILKKEVLVYIKVINKLSNKLVHTL